MRFKEFLVRINQQAGQSQMRHMSSKSDSPVTSDNHPVCNKCSKRHKPDLRCKPSYTGAMYRDGLVQSHLTIAKVTTKEELKTYTEAAKKANGTCPCCRKSHTNERSFSFGKAPVPSRRLHSCPDFVKKSPNERWKIVEKAKACYVCLDYKHEADEGFWKKSRGCGEQTGTDTCGVPHHKLLHDSRVAYCHNAQATSHVLFEVQCPVRLCCCRWP